MKIDMIMASAGSGKTTRLSQVLDDAIGSGGVHADAIVAINTLKAMKIDIDFAKPSLGNRIGGYSGPGIKPV